MFEYIEKLRNRPEKSKKRIAFLGAFSVTAVIIAVWATTLYPDFIDSENRQEAAASKGPSPVGSFLQSFSDGFGAIGEQFANIKNAMSSFSNNAVHYSATTTEASTTESR